MDTFVSEWDGYLPVYFWFDVRTRVFRDNERYGQAVFNVSRMYFAVETDKLRSSLSDPFYHDERVSKFIESLVDQLTRS